MHLSPKTNSFPIVPGDEGNALRASWMTFHWQPDLSPLLTNSTCSRFLITTVPASMCLVQDKEICMWLSYHWVFCLRFDTEKFGKLGSTMHVPSIPCHKVCLWWDWDHCDITGSWGHHPRLRQWSGESWVPNSRPIWKHCILNVLSEDVSFFGFPAYGKKSLRLLSVAIIKMPPLRYWTSGSLWSISKGIGNTFTNCSAWIVTLPKSRPGRSKPNHKGPLHPPCRPGCSHEF